MKQTEPVHKVTPRRISSQHILQRGREGERRPRREERGYGHEHGNMIQGMEWGADLPFTGQVYREGGGEELGDGALVQRKEGGQGSAGRA